MNYFFRTLFLSLILNRALLGFEGAYCGGALGGDIIEGSQKGSAVGTFATHTYPIDLTGDLFNQNFAGMIYAGWGYNWKIFYAALEGFGEYAHQKSTLNHFNNNIFSNSTNEQSAFDKTSVKVGPWRYGLDLRPGLFLAKKTLLYARIGAIRTKLRLETTSANFGFGPDFFSPFDGERQKTDWFFRVGGGMEQRFSPKLSLRADYIFTNFRDLSLAGSNHGLAGTFTTTFTDQKTVHLRSHSFLLGLTYYFSRCAEGFLPNECDPCSPYYCGCYFGVAGGAALMEGKHAAQFA